MSLPGSTSRTISIASFQNGTIAFRPVRLKSSSINSSATSQKYSCPGKEQNQLIHVNVDVGVEEAVSPTYQFTGSFAVTTTKQINRSRRCKVAVERERLDGDETRTISLPILALLHFFIPLTGPGHGLLLFELPLSRVDRCVPRHDRNEETRESGCTWLPRGSPLVAATNSG